MKKSKEENKRIFLEIHSNIPKPIRKEIVLTMEEEIEGKRVDIPMSWDLAYLEILNNSSRSEIILKKLEKLNII